MSTPTPNPRPAILHLLDAPAGADRPPPTLLARIAEVIRGTPAWDHRLLMFGPRWMADVAEDLGLTGRAVRAAVPFHRSLLGWRALRALIRSWRRPDLVHAWSPGAHRLARAALRGVPAVDRPWADRHLPLSVDRERVVGSTRRALRTRWGLADDVRLVALLPGGTGRAPAMDAAVAVGLARECLYAREPPDARVALLIHPATRGLPQVLDMMQQARWHDGLIQDARLAKPWHALPAADAALALGDATRGPEPLWAAAAGVPVIAEAGGRVTDAMQRRGAAVCFEPGLPRQAGFEIVALIRDPGRTASVNAAAARMLDDRFSRQTAGAIATDAYRAAIADRGPGRIGGAAYAFSRLMIW